MIHHFSRHSHDADFPCLADEVLSTLTSFVLDGLRVSHKDVQRSLCCSAEGLKSAWWAVLVELKATSIYKGYGQGAFQDTTS